MVSATFVFFIDFQLFYFLTRIIPTLFSRICVQYSQGHSFINHVILIYLFLCISNIITLLCILSDTVEPVQSDT
jgi:hypothetical protein